MENNEILALPMECWRWVPGYEGWYQVSTRGRVRSVDRWVIFANGTKRFYEGKILKPQRNKKTGYLSVNLCRDGKMHCAKVHRMVAETWLDNPENKPEVNHLNEQKEMNFVENLSWVSRIENQNWGTAIQRAAASRAIPVQAISPSTGQVVMEFPSAAEAERNGFINSAISACCNGKSLSHRGLVWRYKDDYDQEKAWTPVKIGREAIAASQSKAVEAVDPKTGQVVKEFASMNEAERNGFSAGHICNCCRGERKTHKGYIWRFKP